MNVHKIKPLELNQVKIKDKFWSPKLKKYREVTIIDSFTKFQNDRGGALKNYDRVKRGEQGYHAGPEWYDGLVNEMIRGASDFLAIQYDPDLDNRIVEIDSSTEIIKLVKKEEEEYKLELDKFYKDNKKLLEQTVNTLDYPAHPSLCNKIEVSATELQTGQRVEVKTSENIRDKKQFIAQEIIIQCQS